MLMQVNDKEIYYEITGSGPAVVFCHGFGGNHVVWMEQVAYLVRHGYQTITFDLPGHGESGPPAVTMAELADDMAQLIKNLTLGPIILIGHSMGAGLTWALLKYHPELSIAKVLTVDQPPKMLNDTEWHYGWTHGDLKLTQDNFRQVLIKNDHVKETLNGIDKRVWTKLFPFKKKHPFKREENLPLLFDHIQKDWRSAVYGIKIPALTVSSSKSPYFPLGYTAEMQKNNQNIRVNVVTDTGHAIMAEQPDEFNELMGQFLGIE